MYLKHDAGRLPIDFPVGIESLAIPRPAQFTAPLRIPIAILLLATRQSDFGYSQMARRNAGTGRVKSGSAI